MLDAMISPVGRGQKMIKRAADGSNHEHAPKTDAKQEICDCGVSSDAAKVGSAVQDQGTREHHEQEEENKSAGSAAVHGQKNDEGKQNQGSNQ